MAKVKTVNVKDFCCFCVIDLINAWHSKIPPPDNKEHVQKHLWWLLIYNNCWSLSIHLRYLLTYFHSLNLKSCKVHLKLSFFWKAQIEAAELVFFRFDHSLLIHVHERWAAQAIFRSNSSLVIAASCIKNYGHIKVIFHIHLCW